MRKNRWILVILIVLILSMSGCSPATPSVPEDAVPIHLLFDPKDGFRNQDLNVLKIVEYHFEYLVVELNGTRYTVIQDSHTMANTINVAYFSDEGTAWFEIFNAFDFYAWSRMKNDNPSMEFYVFRDGLRSRDEFDFGDPAIELVLVARDKMPKVVDPISWDSTEATIQIWRSPITLPNIIQNIDTGEVAFVVYTTAVDDNGNIFDIRSDSLMWGYLSVSDYEGDWSIVQGLSIIEIRQTK